MPKTPRLAIEQTFGPQLRRRSQTVPARDRDLLSNALKYSPEGAIVEAAVHWNSDEVEIEIADRGAGIPDDLKRKLFEKFGSLEVTRGESPRGIGHGLYLVRLVANAHGGRAVVRDREGGGTAFALLLPPVNEALNH